MGVSKPTTYRLEIITVLALLSLIVLVRIYKLDADPPTGLSKSADVYTDPAQYTMFAKMYDQHGEFNPFHDHQLAVFLKSSVTLLAVVVFRLLGVGLWQSNFIGLLYSLGALFLFFLFVRRTAGTVAGLLYLILICFNYNLLFYGRLPFLEHAMAFYAFLSLVLMTYFSRGIGYLAAGLSLGIAIFFGKMIGMVFLFPFACFLLYRFFYEETPRKAVKPLLFIAGVGAAAVFWYFFTYAPMKAQVAGYFGEQAFSLYGAPEGLKSLDDFVWKMVSLGESSRLFSRMPLVGLLGAIFIGMILYHIARGKSWREGFGSFNAGHIFVAAMIIAFYGSLMIWNYRPLRYQLVLIYPFYGAAAIILSMLWQKQPSAKSGRMPYLFYLFCLPLIMVSLYQMYSAIADHVGYEFCYNDNKYLLVGISVMVSILIGLVVALYKGGKNPSLGLTRKVIVIIVLVVMPLIGFLHYLGWSNRSTFTARDNALDLGMILSPEAVLSGPYAPALTLENNLGCVIHMFGVSAADPDFFMRFPITHLLVDQTNESRAVEDYSDLMDSAVHILTYHVGLKQIRLFRVVDGTNNPEAHRYQLSHFEKTLDRYNENSIDEANVMALAFLNEHPDNISCHSLVAEEAELHNNPEIARGAFKKAVEFSPTNYHLNARLAKFLKDRYETSGDRRLREEGLQYFERAIKYAPTVATIKKTYQNLKENDPWQLKSDTIPSTPMVIDSSSPP